MQRMQVTCGTCSGFGKEIRWKAVPLNSTMGTMEREESPCVICGGRGYTEYAVFSIEEAEAILKHCGLDKE